MTATHGIHDTSRRRGTEARFLLGAALSRCVAIGQPGNANEENQKLDAYPPTTATVTRDC